MKSFSWEYLSLVTLDQPGYKEILLIPVLLAVLSFLWMKLVRGEKEYLKDATEDQKNKEGIDIVEAYQDVLLNEVDSGTEIDSPNEDEGEEKDVSVTEEVKESKEVAVEDKPEKDEDEPEEKDEVEEEKTLNRRASLRSSKSSRTNLAEEKDEAGEGAEEDKKDL